MAKQKVVSSFSYAELGFQLLLHLVVFLFYSFDKRDPQIHWHQVAFFAQYASAAALVNYYLLPRYFYSKRYGHFFVGIALIIGAVMWTEERVLEPFFFTGPIANNFPGFFFTLAQICPVIVILSGFKFAWDATQKQREVENLRALVKESELQFLKSQINPHFLFNNLNNLYAYAVEHSPKTPELILKLSKVLWYMLYECRGASVPLQKEVEQLENFAELSELQIEDRGRVHFSRQWATECYRIAPLILIVFIENAFKHSAASQVADIEIEVAVVVSPEGRLDFSCRNSYRSQSNTEHLSQGIGLANVKKRLALLYPQAHSLHIEQSEETYRVSLSIELHQSPPS